MSDFITPHKLQFPVLHDKTTGKRFTLDGETEIKAEVQSYEFFYNGRKLSEAEVDYIVKEYLWYKRTYEALISRMEDLVVLGKRRH
jgi:hypothetical protein